MIDNNIRVMHGYVLNPADIACNKLYLTFRNQSVADCSPPRYGGQVQYLDLTTFVLTVNGLSLIKPVRRAQFDPNYWYKYQCLKKPIGTCRQAAGRSLNQWRLSSLSPVGRNASTRATGKYKWCLLTCRGPHQCVMPIEYRLMKCNVI